MVARAALALFVLLALAAPVHADASSEFAVKKLQLELHDARVERAHASRFWPLLMLGVGAASVVTGATVGIVDVLSCDHNCSAPPWVGLAVVAGAAVGAVGTAWLVRANHSIAEHDSQVHRLERELDEQQRHPTGPHAALPSTRPLFSLRFVF